MRSARGRGSGTISEPKTYTLEARGAVLCYDVREGGGAGQPVLNQARAYTYASRVAGLVDAHRVCCGSPAPGPVASGVARKGHIGSPILRTARSTPAGHGHDQPRRMLTASRHSRRHLPPPATHRNTPH